MDFMSTMRGLKRVVVDPNVFSRLNPDWSPVLWTDGSSLPEEGETVIAVQDYPGEVDLISTATVAEVDAARSLIYLKVDWDGFVDDRSTERSSGVANMRTVLVTSVYDHRQRHRSVGRNAGAVVPV